MLCACLNSLYIIAWILGEGGELTCLITCMYEYNVHVCVWEYTCMLEVVVIYQNLCGYGVHSVKVPIYTYMYMYVHQCVFL